MKDPEQENPLEIAKFYMLNNRFDKAEETLKKIIKKEPHNIEALFHMGLLYELLNRLTEAREYYKKVLELFPNHELAQEHISKLQGK